MKREFAFAVKLGTIRKLAKRLGTENDVLTAKDRLAEFFEANWKAVIEPSIETVVDIPKAEALLKDDELYSMCVDIYTDGMYRGYLAGMAAMEKLLLFCDEPGDQAVTATEKQKDRRIGVPTVPG